MELPTISVLMPCYNNSKYILEAVQSVLAQTYRDLELVIVDDASTDASVAIVESIGERRIRLVRNEKNRGIAAVRNQLLSLARGRYISSLDGDDIYRSPDKLATELRLMQSMSRNSIVYSDVELIDGQGAVLSRASQSMPTREGILFQGLLDRTIMIPRDFLVSSELARSVGGFDENLAIYEDWDYKLRLAQRAHFVYTGQIGIGYRRHGGGLSSASKKVHRHCREWIRCKYGIQGFDNTAVKWLQMAIGRTESQAYTKAA